MDSVHPRVRLAADRPRALVKHRVTSRSKSRLRRLALEALEVRSLMAVLPPATVNGQVNLSNPAGAASLVTSNETSPSVAVDPADPRKLISVWTRNDPTAGISNGQTPIFVEGAYTADGGTTWNPLPGLTNLANGVPDFAQAQDRGPRYFAQATDPTVAFDRADQAYVAFSLHSGGNASGEVVLAKFDFAGMVPTGAPSTPRPLYTWTQDAALNPVVAVDGNVASFSDPTTGASQSDPYTGNVYVAWGTRNNLADGNTNAYRVDMVASSDGGQTFTSPLPLNTGVNNGPAAATPDLTISQGNVGKSVAGGQVNVVWNSLDGGIWADRVNGANAAADFAYNLGNPITIAYATDPGGNQPHNPVTSTFDLPVNINASKFTTVRDLQATVGISTSYANELKVVLVPPSGSNLPTITLLNNNVDAANNTTNQGVGGGNLGSTAGGAFLGTVFDQFAPRSIVGNGGGNASQGHFQPSGSLGVYNGATVGQVNGTWTLQVTDYRARGATPPVQTLQAFSLHFSSGLANGVNIQLAGDPAKGFSSPAVAGSPTAPYPLRTAASPDLGVAPAPVITSDNTLGSFSPYEGRLYVAYVGPGGGPADNTDIFLATSDDGGLTWKKGAPVNRENSAADGFSESVPGKLGRPQFQPAVAVDQSTGTLVVSYRDGRNDAARARVATVLTTSLDGGASFAPIASANPAKTAIDAATGNTVNLGPYPDNASGANANRDTTFDFGNRMGLAAASGHVTPVWSANFNAGVQGTIKTTGATDIVVANATIAAGPRIVSSTMGPVGEPGDTLNARRAANGTPEASSFVVTFDRPIDDTLGGNGVFGLSNVEIYYRGTVPGDAAVLINPTSITPLDRTPFGATTFRVDFPPQQRVGTYSYLIRPALRDRIRTVATATSAAAPGAIMDQNGNAKAGEDVLPGQQGPGDVYATPGPTGTFLYNGGFFPFAFDQNTLPLIVPGPHLISTNVANNPASGDNLVLNGVVGANSDGTQGFGVPAVHPGLDVTFDRDMDPTSFTGAQVLRMMGPAGLVNGPFTVTLSPANLDANRPRTFRVSFPPQDLSGTYVLTLSADIRSAAGDKLDTNLNAGVDILFGAANSTSVTTKAVSFEATTAVTAASPTPQTLPVAIPDATAVPAPGVATPGELRSDLTVTDDFLIQKVTAAGLGGLTVHLGITHPNDPDLEVTLLGPARADGTRPSVLLFANVGSAGTRANFVNTVLDDRATATPIQNGGPPFFGTFAPQFGSLLSTFGGLRSAGVWTLVVRDLVANNGGPRPQPQSLNSWGLTFQKPLPGSGLGEPVADRATASFRIFTMDPTNPLASSTWTAVGPASIGGGRSGRIGGLAVDPSDPSGNTVYVGGASGGIWKTTNFLRPGGPTYIPLTDFGPTFGINIGGIAAFGRNNDPNQSILFAATGEGDTGSKGVGFLRSMDGGATWTLQDSTDNSLPFSAAAGQPQRDHAFAIGGGASFKIVVDPKPTAAGDVIVYAALSGGNGGLWRSIDSGVHWQNMRAGQATDVVLDPNSGNGAPGGNLQILYVAYRGEGVFMSPNRGQVLTLMTGGIGDPLIQDKVTNNPIGVAAPPSTPNGAKGRIALAKPELTGDPAADLVYQGWLYAEVVNPDSSTDGLYLTKDFGQNWTKLHISTLPPVPDPNNPTGPQAIRAIPTNDETKGDYDVGGGPPGTGLPKQGNYDISLGIDPTNPNVVYLGGTQDGQPTGFLRIDASTVYDPHALVGGAENRPDGGKLDGASVGAISGAVTFNKNSYLNFIRNPGSPFSAGSTLQVTGANGGTRFTNSGAEVKWIPFDIGGTDQHRIIVTKDPLTGHARLIIGDDQGVFSAVDNNGTFDSGIGTARAPGGSFNGNLQITQFYYGASQPSTLSLNQQVRAALFYGSAQDNGGPTSDGNILNNGNLSWGGPDGDAIGVATNPQGDGTLYQYWWPCCGGDGTSFFKVDGVGKTFGLLQQANPGPTPDPQWPFTGGSNFAVNPLNGDQILISSQAGRIFSTETRGNLWLPIGNPAALDGTYAPALAFGAPDPNGPGGVGNLNNLIYVGTSGGHIYVSQVGGGANGNNYTDISAGLGGSGVSQIVTNPTRGSHEAYAVTIGGVYHMVNSTAPGATWVNITGNLFQVTHNDFGVAALVDTQAKVFSSIQADYRYVIPDNFAAPDGPTHPLLYVGGEGGVYRSLDNGVTWGLFPDMGPGSLNNSPVQGGNLPNAHVSALSMVLGNINPTTGRPDVSTGPDLLLASTYGRGSFAIRLAPLVFPNTATQTNLLTITTASGTGTSNGNRVSNDPRPIVRGFSEQTAFGNTVTIRLLDLTPGANGLPVDPNVATPIGTATTDATGRFTVRVSVPFTTSGVKTIGVQAINAAGTKGNVATLSYTFLNTPPATPSAPVLEAASDTELGVGGADLLPNGEEITKVTAPVFDVSNFTFSTASSPISTQLLRKVARAADSTYVVVGQVLNPVLPTTGTPPTFVAITDTGGASPAVPVPAGRYEYAARQLDLAGNFSVPNSPSLLVTIDTGAPSTPTVPTLAAADDSGVLGDNKTNVVRPRLRGTLAPETPAELPATVQIVKVVGATITVLGSATVNPVDNSYLVPFTNALPNGPITVQARAVDLAGNFGPLSAPYTLTISTVAPAVPTLDIFPTDDTEVGGGADSIPNGEITRISRPRMIGTATPGLNIDLVFASARDTPLASTVVPPGGALLGSYLVQFPTALLDGTYTVLARARDVFGNTSFSAPLTLQILTKGPVTPPTLFLAATDQYGNGFGPGNFTTAVRKATLVGVADPGPNTYVDVTTPDGSLVGTTQVGADGKFSVLLNQNYSNGRITLQARARDLAGNTGPLGSTINLTFTTVLGDYDGEGKAGVVTFRPPNATFSIANANGSAAMVGFGAPNLDIPVQADFDGDGRTDIGLFRPTDGTWSLLQTTAGARLATLGVPGSLPVPGNYDGPGRAELATYDPSTGNWTILSSVTNTPYTIHFGQAFDDVPVPADYFGDGRTDIAVYRRSTGEFLVRNTNTQAVSTLTVTKVGAPNLDIPIPADYDGDGKADFATFQPSTATWTIRNSGNGQTLAFAFGATNLDIPVPRDYDGDGRADVALYRPTTSTFSILLSTGGVMILPFGAPNLDLPVAGPLTSRTPSRASSGQSLSTRSISVQPNLAAPRFASAAVLAPVDFTPTTAPAPATTLDFGRQAATFAAVRPAVAAAPAVAPPWVAQRTATPARRQPAKARLHLASHRVKAHLQGAALDNLARRHILS